MMPVDPFVDPFDVLETVFQWNTVVRVLVLAVELFVCVRVGKALGKWWARRPKLKRAAAVAVCAGACLCVACFFRNMKEDYAYWLLGAEFGDDAPYAMRWLVENGSTRRLVRTVRAPFDEDDIEWCNIRLYAALVLAKKDPGRGREVLPAVPPFQSPGLADFSWVFGTNRYSFPASGAEVLQMEWNDGRNPIPEERRER